jgi:hypothetical protein
MPKEFDCKECGTTMRSSMDEELVRAERYHMKEYHKAEDLEGRGPEGAAEHRRVIGPRLEGSLQNLSCCGLMAACAYCSNLGSDRTLLSRSVGTRWN